MKTGDIFAYCLRVLVGVNRIPYSFKVSSYIFKKKEIKNCAADKKSIKIHFCAVMELLMMLVCMWDLIMWISSYIYSKFNILYILYLNWENYIMLW